MLIILFITRKAFISASLVTKLQSFSDAYKFVWATIWETNLLKLMAFSKTSNGLGSLENVFAVRSHCTFSFDLSVLFYLKVADLLLEQTG